MSETSLQREALPSVPEGGVWHEVQLTGFPRQNTPEVEKACLHYLASLRAAKHTSLATVFREARSANKHRPLSLGFWDDETHARYVADMLRKMSAKVAIINHEVP